ncbi:hypothetical protein [Streptococcus hyovaginalis]|nr:hypothetical protein [Streptococcus hyovaginalis]
MAKYHEYFLGLADLKNSKPKLFIELTQNDSSAKIKSIIISGGRK